MSHEHVIRAWKDAEYREGLSAAERAALPDHPAGLTEPGEAELGQVEGGMILVQTLQVMGCGIVQPLPPNLTLIGFTCPGPVSVNFPCGPWW